MYAQKLLLPAFALLSLASAQTSACASATVTINAQADAALYTGCPSLKNVVIGPDADGTIDLSGPTTVTGDVVVHNAGNLLSLSSSSIATIGGTFDLFNLTLLSTLSFTKFTQVGIINWNTLPALDRLTFPAILTKATGVLIANTFLSDLQGINLKTVATMDINNNNRLSKFETQVANITKSINIAANGKVLDISFPNLIWANSASFRDVKSLSTPSLATINESLTFNNNAFDGYTAPNLTTVGNFAQKVGSLAFVGNNLINNITLPAITSIGGGIQIANNTELQSISLGALQSVGGAIDLSGNFSTPSLTALKNVQGALNIQSTQTIDCASFKKLKDSGVVQGKSSCVSATTDPTALESGTTTGSGAAASGTNKGSANALYVSEAVAGLSVFGAMLQLLL